VKTVRLAGEIKITKYKKHSKRFLRYPSHIFVIGFLCAFTCVAAHVMMIVQGEDKVKSYSSKDVIRVLKEDGWFEVSCEGSHHQFKHRTKPGKTTVKDPQKDIPKKTLQRIEEQSGVKFD